MTYEEGQILNLFLYSIPFWVPAAIGLYLVVRKPSDLSLMAGLLTLKPIVTTPIWVAIIRPLFASGPLKPAHFLSILPGASLTLIIVLVFRHQFSGPGSGSARALLVLDCARWLNSFLLILPYGNVGIEALGCIFAIIGLTLPTVFAVLALTLSLTRIQEQV
jgi:hypothetical protein